MKKYTYLVNFDSQTLERVGESFAVKGDGGIAELEFVIPSNFGVPANQALWRVFFKPPGEKESLFETLPTVAATQSGDYVTAWVISKAITQKAGRLAFSLAAISGNDIQWNSRTVIMQVPESQYQPESEEAEEPYTGRLTILEGDMAQIRGEFAEVQEDFEDLKETATLGTPIPESLVANMTEGHVYIYTGTEPGYTAGHVYYYVGGTLTDGGVYGGTAVDATLTQSGQAADAKVTGDEIATVKEDLSHKADYDFSYTTNTGAGKYLTTSNVWKEDTRFHYIYTNIIPCAAGDIFEYIGGSYVAASVLYYKNGAFVSGVNYTANTKVTIPENVDGVVFQSAKTTVVTLSVKKIFPHTVSDIILGTGAKSGMVWTKTESGAEWSQFSYDDPFADKIDFATIFDDESLYSMAMEDGIARYSRVEIPAHSIIKKVRFKSSDAGSGYIQIATTEFVSNFYMMNVKAYPVDYVAGWNEIEINFATGNHTEYLLGFSNLKILYGDYTSLSGTIDAKYMFGRGLQYNSNASNAIGSENIRFAFGNSQSGANYKFCVAFDADIYTGDFIKNLDELSQKTLPASINTLKYKVVDGSIGYVGRWYDYTENGSTYKVASADGAYICFKVSGATSVTILWGGNFTANSCISYKIDDGEYVRVDVDVAGNTITIPDTNEHIIQIVMDAINVPNSTWWTVGNGIGIKDVNTDGTLKAVTPTNKRIIFFGDSLTQGVRALGTESTEMPNGNSAINSYGWYMAKYLNANPILVGYGSSGITKNGAFKKCIDAINYVADGKDSEDLDVDLIVINHGHNDTGASSENFIAGYNEVLNRFVTKYPATPVFCVTPFNSRHADDVKACAEAKANCYFVNTYPLYLNRYYADGPGHLLVEGADICGRYLAQKAVDFGII